MVTPALLADVESIARISSIPTILRAMAELTGMRFTVVARVTPETWTACAVYDQMGFGMNVGDQLEVATTLCKEVHDSKKTILIEHASQDPNYSTHRTPKLYNIESYLAIPILQPDGQVFGTLCSIDRNPASLPKNVVQALTLFADLISRELAAEAARQETESALARERKLGELREQFMAVLGHDLRAPLSGISATAALLDETRGEPPAADTIEGLKDSVQQMAHLIDRTMDFARSKLGGGLDVSIGSPIDIAPLLRSAVDELASGPNKARFSTAIEPQLVASVDAVRLRQVVTNLLSNALHHGLSQTPIFVRAQKLEDSIEIFVANASAPITEGTLRTIFEPFRSGTTNKFHRGLGLGLYIASEIVRAHNGAIRAAYEGGLITFIVSIPSKKSDTIRLVHVEDNGADSELLGLHLKRTWPAIELETVSTEAQFRKALQSELRLVISDSNIPGFDGYDALALSQDLKPGIPFVFFCGDSRETSKQSALSRGAAAFVAKDFPDELVAEIRRLAFGSREQARS